MRAGRAVRSLLVAVVWLVAACGATMATPPSAMTPLATPVEASGIPETTPAASATPPATAATPSASAAVGGLVVDASLLDVLPPTVDGVTMEPDPATAEALLGEADLSASASGVAIARYVGAGGPSGDPSGDDIVVASIVQLRPGVFSEPFYETWRDEYDRSACEPAGGVTGAEAEVAIGRFPAHVGTCAGGATTYHVHLDGDVLVSLLAVGPAALGDQVVTGLRP